MTLVTVIVTLLLCPNGSCHHKAINVLTRNVRLTCRQSVRTSLRRRLQVVLSSRKAYETAHRWPGWPRATILPQQGTVAAGALMTRRSPQWQKHYNLSQYTLAYAETAHECTTSKAAQTQAANELRAVYTMPLAYHNLRQGLKSPKWPMRSTNSWLTMPSHPGGNRISCWKKKTMTSLHQEPSRTSNQMPKNMGLKPGKLQPSKTWVWSRKVTTKQVAHRHPKPTLPQHKLWLELTPRSLVPLATLKSKVRPVQLAPRPCWLPEMLSLVTCHMHFE